MDADRNIDRNGSMDTDRKHTMNIVSLERNTAGTDISVDCFSELGNVTIYGSTETEEEIRERVKSADIIIINKSPMNERTLKEAPNVKLICELATGYDNCDLVYCSSRGIRVTNVRDYSTDMVAQHTFTLALSLSQKLMHYDNYVKSGAYSSQSGFSCFTPSFQELAGKTWGIVGMGNIGKKVAKIAAAFGCRVIFHSITGTSSCTDYPQVSMDTLLEESDILSLHCPLSELSRNLIDKEALRKMKKTAILINVARGAVVNNDDLYEALVTGEIQAAGLDVLEQEPLTESNPLSRLKDSSKLIITPHLAWASIEARTRCVQGVYENIKAFLSGEPKNVVNETMVRIARMEQDREELTKAWQEQQTAIFSNADLRQKIKTLTNYMESGQWLLDYEAEERGELPKNLKRGVLSQDALYNLLEEIRQEKDGNFHE